jgi:hypothetical protein
MRRRSIAVALAFIVTCCLASSAARAEDVEKQVQKMNKRAMDDYDALEFDSARHTLLEALQLLRGGNLEDSPLFAKTSLNLGIVYINGFKDRAHGVQQLVNALKAAPSIKIDATVATPETDEAFAAALKQANKGGKGGRTTPPPSPPPSSIDRTPEPPPPPEKPVTPPAEEVHGLVHNALDESRPNSPVPVRAKLGSDAGATRVFMFYRGSGQEDFVAVPMKNTSGVDWVGVIPPEAVVGKSLQYYLEARDPRGRAVVGSGSSINPYIIVITDSAPPPTNVPEVDVEDPLMRERLAKQRQKDEHRTTRDHLFVFVMPGFGFGVEPAGNHTEVAWQYQTTGSRMDSYVAQPVGATGIAVAPFHIAAEVGYLLTPHWSLSLFGRFQLVTAANAETQRLTKMEQAPTSKAFGAIAGFVRARYRFLDGRFHPYVHLDIGGGEIRHSLDISAAQSTEHPLVDQYTAAQYNSGNKAVTLQPVCTPGKTCTDSIALGLFFIGGGAGIWYDIGSHFAFIFDLNLLGAIGTGAGQSGANFDVQVGLGAHFL